MRAVFMLLNMPADRVLTLYDFVHFAFEAFERERLGSVFGAADEALLKPLFGLVRHIFGLYDAEQRGALTLATVRTIAQRVDHRAAVGMSRMLLACVNVSS